MYLALFLTTWLMESHSDRKIPYDLKFYLGNIFIFSLNFVDQINLKSQKLLAKQQLSSIL